MPPWLVGRPAAVHAPPNLPLEEVHVPDSNVGHRSRTDLSVAWHVQLQIFNHDAQMTADDCRRTSVQSRFTPIAVTI